MNETADRTESLFAAAVALATPEQRAAYLDQACAGDPALRARVEALLRAHDRAGHLLDRPALDDADRTGAYRAPTELPGTVVAGRYKLLEEIGEGGMGTVWVAEQTAPVRRKVALKLVKPGLDSRSVLARFEAERQALALMDHPNIAKVLDGGLTDAGRPYFVMEYVKGVPITEYCDATRLSVSERLQLFVQVCQAVQHAHQKGIIHRDLKPSNILVAPYDDKPVPKVIDFGLAKAMHQSLTERTLHTAHETVLGTPLYMSPEQAQLNNLDVDTRSDIYSLGVLLYELLTGTTPISRLRLREAAWDEVRRIIREEEPPRPSTRLSSTQTLPSLAACRQTEPAKLTKLVRGELDWVVMKALEKDRTRRYETANGFAMDIQRYLTGEAVLAVPPSAGYRMRKFARRHRGALATAAVLTVALLLALGTAAASIGYVARDRTARQAETERERAMRQAKTEAEVEEALREADFFRTQTRWPEALAAARKAAAILKSGEGGSALQERVRAIVADLEMINTLEDILLQKSTSQNNRLEMQQSDTDYAAAFRRYGIDIDALGVDEAAQRVRARPIQVELSAALDDWVLSRSIRGADNPGTKHLRAVVRAADPDPWRNRVRDAMSSPLQDPLQDRKTLLVKLAAEVPVQELRPVTMILLGVALNTHGANEPAAALLGKAQRLHPDNFWINHDLGWSLQRMDPPRLEESLRYYMAALALRPRNSVIRIDLATALVKQGAVNEGLGAYRDATQLGLVDGRTLYGLGVALDAKGKLDEAIAVYRETIRLTPGVALVRVLVRINLGNALRQKGLLDEAIAEFREVRRLRPNDAQNRTNLADTLHQRGLLDEAVTAYQEAEPLLRNRLDVQRRTPDPESVAVAAALVDLGYNLLKQQKYAAAEPLLRECLTIREKKLPDDYRRFNAQCLLGESLAGQQKYAEAEPLLLAGYEGLKTREAKMPAAAKKYVTEAIERLVQLYDAQGKPDEAAKWRKELEASAPNSKDR